MPPFNSSHTTSSAYSQSPALVAVTAAATELLNAVVTTTPAQNTTEPCLQYPSSNCSSPPTAPQITFWVLSTVLGLTGLTLAIWQIRKAVTPTPETTENGGEGQVENTDEENVEGLVEELTSGEGSQLQTSTSQVESLQPSFE